MTGDPLRIALVAPPWFPVPPEAYGGIELVVALLADGLVRAGHDVTLFASGDSRTTATLCAAYEHAPSEWIGNAYHELRHSLGCFGRASDFDLVHDHTGMLGLILGGVVATPLVHTVHGPVDGEPGWLYDQLCRLLPAPYLISISRSQQRMRPSLPWVANCPNAIDFASYPFAPARGDYLCFIGRMSPEKGAHRAIEVAQRAGLPLKIAAKMREPLERAYFEEYVRPHLDGRIEYLGEVGHAEKTALLRGARATLCPIGWEEPFGLVMVESMACGTPVIATRRGSVVEVVEDGVTGVIVDSHEEMAAALELADRLDPAVVRRRAERRFAPERMVADHLAAYTSVLTQTHPAGDADTERPRRPDRVASRPARPRPRRALTAPEAPSGRQAVAERA
jgi:glycosyltransferase involved in cell wall biosynthesis